MSRIAIVFYSGYGHTAKLAESVAKGAGDAALLPIDANGDLSDAAWEQLAQAGAIIYGSPTYMGGPAWQFKKFADTSAKVWRTSGWKDKAAAGFTNSASVNGDKFSTIAYLWTLSQQHGQVWIGTGLHAANYKKHGPDDVNWTAGYGGVFAISPADAGPDEAPRAGDLETGRLLGKRVSDFLDRLK